MDRLPGRALLATCALLAVATPASAAYSNVALNKPTSGSGFYNVGSETFPFDNINDGRLNDTGTSGDWSFWLGRQTTANEFVTINLQGSFVIDKFELQNTHNRAADDRGTRDFRIGVSTDGTNFTTILSGTLNSVAGTANNIPLQTFTVAPTAATHVRFTGVNFYGAGSGLNELRAFAETAPAAVPAPPGVVLMGAGLASLLAFGGSRCLRNASAGRTAAGAKLLPA